ncbi:MAG: UDP-N-acetylmuramoyl-L-alanine--D-glutamate ligase [Candidatus Eisenbacteria bacterium]|nr:UDP-N-acetylmuramoyl-L-alanine--D-glutamate ligase [Candidatus Eisenbacteria bacterium]
MTHAPDTLGLPGLSALVVGLARSGTAAALLLRRHGFAVRALDSKARGAVAAAERLERAGVECRLESQDPTALVGMDFVVVSPGVGPGNPLLEAARDRGVPVLSELEVAFRFVRGPVLAVTGTNGKTTTATWLAHLVRAAGREAHLAGNVGAALSGECDRLPEDTFAVLEVSSFQLERIHRFRPRSASLLNLTPDHLDRYASMAEYVAAKARIFENQGPSDLAVLNARDPAAMALAPGLRAELALFSARGPVRTGAGVEAGVITLYREGVATPVTEAAKLALPGPHNLENALAALAMTLPWKFEPARLAQGLADFPPLPHRLEPCGEIGGVRFVNDSKATNVDSMEKALRAFDAPLHLVAGGHDKHGDFEALAPLVQEKVRTLLLIGEAAERIARAYPGALAVRCATLQEAMAEGLKRAAPGEVVLLSPGCASYDMFRDYEDRGDQFRAHVARLRTGRKDG